MGKKEIEEKERMIKQLSKIRKLIEKADDLALDLGLDLWKSIKEQEKKSAEGGT